ncbi:MAG: hypothetical protein IPG59_11520 [Candidatus Melainabacteria bacterium]|nr:MAG: hypothetical protein IPG59_11520 [Candidatus Melainabacteria bacterium]
MWSTESDLFCCKCNFEHKKIELRRFRQLTRYSRS